VLDKFVLDGVVDPVQFSDGVNYSGDTFMDAVTSAFFIYCNLAGPVLCPFYTGTTALDIYNRFEASFTQLDATYAAAQNWTNATTIEKALELVKSYLFNAAYTPIASFPTLSKQGLLLEAALAAGKLKEFVALATPPSQPSNTTAWDPAVRCPDGGDVLYNLTFKDLQPYITQLENQSVIAGEVSAHVQVLCTGWSIVADEVFRGKQQKAMVKEFSCLTGSLGPFGGSTQIPILFVSNTMDPVTPIIK
jgi:hypothetical protein